MKKSVSIILFLLLAQCVSAQYEPMYKDRHDLPSDGKPLHAYYLGVGSGLFGKYGLVGLNFSTRINTATVGEITMGLGGWGTKTGVSITTFAGPKNSWCPSLGLSRNSGNTDIPLDVKVSNNGSADITVNTHVNFKPVNVLHASVQRQFLSKKGNRFFLEMGLSILLNEAKVEFNDYSVDYYGTTIKTADLRFAKDQAAVFSLMSPGGLNLSLGYQFGLGKY